MNTFAALSARVKPLVERLDQLSLRERGLVFGGGVALIYIAWQTLLMDPLAVRTRLAEQRLNDARQRTQLLDQVGMAAAQDPAIAAERRNHALAVRLAALDAQLASAAQGYVAPDRMTELLRQLLASQQGLRLVSLKNLPVESLSRPDGTAPGTAVAATAGAAPAETVASDRGPFLHPVEIVLDGDYLSVVAYLHELEKLPWRIHWQRLELLAGDYPTTRVRIVIGALSLSRDWMTV